MLGQEDRRADREPLVKQPLKTRCCTKGPIDRGALEETVRQV